jgi:hypothetical protein
MRIGVDKNTWKREDRNQKSSELTGYMAYPFVLAFVEMLAWIVFGL